MNTQRRVRLALVATLIVGSVTVAAVPADAGPPQRGKPGNVTVSVEDATA